MSNMTKRVILALAVISALCGGFAVVAAGKGNDGKVVVCHKGDEITVSVNALKGHEGHGDHKGPCDPASTPRPSEPVVTATAPPPTAVPPTPTPPLTPTAVPPTPTPTPVVPTITPIVTATAGV